ncbi:MAG: radical SAM protein [Myxococcota bacterium]
MSCSGFDVSFSKLSTILGGPGRAASVAGALRHGRRPEEAAVKPKALEGLSLVEAHRDLEVAARDGTRRFRFSGKSGAWESVLIPNASRSTVCVSTQVGCRRGCSFCATGTLSRPTNLSSSEIIHQVWYAIKRAQELGAPTVRNVVFMGMGEPLDNLRRVERAVKLLVDGRLWGFGPRHVTVSTVAPSPKAVSRLGPWPVRVAWSLHAAEDQKRRKLVASQSSSVEALAEAFRRLARPLFVEMTLIDGVNDLASDAEAAAWLFRNFESEVRFNLLPVNPSDVRPGHRPPPPERVEAFAARLRERGHRVMLRRPRGDDEAAACGQLVTLPRPEAAAEPAARSG